MKNASLQQQVDIEKRGAPRRRCSVYVTFGSGFHVATAQIVDYSETGLRLNASSRTHVGDTIEIIDAESPLFRKKRGRIMWQKIGLRGVREFGVRLIAEKEPVRSESRLDQMWLAIQQIALEDAFA